MKVGYFKSDFCSLYFEKEKKLGIGVLKGFLNKEQYQEAFGQGMAMIWEHQLTRFLLDNREMKAIRQADQFWTMKEVVPSISTSTLQKLAVIRSADIFNQMAIRSMYAEVKQILPFEAISFDTEQEAMQWLGDGVPVPKKTDHL